MTKKLFTGLNLNFQLNVWRQRVWGAAEAKVEHWLKEIKDDESSLGKMVWGEGKMRVGAMSKDDDGALHEVYKALKCFSVEELHLIHRW